MLNKLKEIAKYNLPNKVYDFLLPIYFEVSKPFNSFLFEIKLNQVRKNHEKALNDVRNKEKIKVAFFLIHESVWKYEGLYRLFEIDSRFDPVVIVCPYISFGEEHMKREMNSAYDSFYNKGYRVIKTLTDNGDWLDVKKMIKPDLIFFTNPHKITKDEYYITNYSDTLTCYVPYAFMSVNTYQSQFNQPFHNLVWKSFYETGIHKEIAEKHANNKGENVIVSGYPGCDLFLDENYEPDNYWEFAQLKKRVIWSPHHLMKEGLKMSNFLEYYQIMYEIAQKFSDEIYFILKPHPIIKPKLFEYPEWGIERTNQYFKMWNDLPNAHVYEGDYIDLFLTSDAIIHDCGSFITEYIFTGKPSLFMVSNVEVMKGWNDFGTLAINALYHSYSRNDIENFLQDVVIKGNDPMKSKRENFLNEVLLPPNGLTASENIANYIKELIN